MEFNKKLQEIRKQKGLTQEELARALYVSRTAISKWESGRGYPNIESLKAISKFFSVTVDDLLSTDEILTIAEENVKQKERCFCDIVCGILDVCMAFLYFLPFFSAKTPVGAVPYSLLSLVVVPSYLKISYFAIVTAMIAAGILTLALQNCQQVFWLKCKTKISLLLGVLAVLIFIISLQPYAAVFAFVLLAIKAFLSMTRSVSHP
jgi:transcriptional regulator with XRE-family HTH domain